MTIDAMLTNLPAFAKDIKLNTSMILSEEGSAGLSKKQISFIALACAYAIKNVQLTEALYTAAQNDLSAAELDAAKAAAMIMAMNNVYYRFVHVVEDKSYGTMPAKLRMNVINQSGADKIDFELASLAVSAINNCTACMDAHIDHVVKAGVSKEAVQSSVRIAAVLNALAVVL